MTSGYGGNGSTWLLASRHQLGLELACVGPVGAPGRISAKVWFFEHGVHDVLRAHDLARYKTSIQGGFTGRLRISAHLNPKNGCANLQSLSFRHIKQKNQTGFAAFRCILLDFGATEIAAPIATQCFIRSGVIGLP